MLEKFLIFNQVDDRSHFLFDTKNFGSFCNKIKKVSRYDVRAFIHKNRNNRSASKLSREDEELAIKEFSNGRRYGIATITQKVNSQRISRGEATISSQSVRRCISHNTKYSIAKTLRNGTAGVSNLVGHPSRQQPQNPADLYQMDGTRLNVIYKGENGIAEFLYMVVVLDVFSKKILGYALGKKESYQLYLDALRMTIEQTKFLPAEILSDNLSSFSTNSFMDFVTSASSLGTSFRKHVPHNPQDKGHIENWFRIFGNGYLKDVPGYVGDGIRSKDPNGKPNTDVIKEYRKRKNLQSKEEVIKQFEQALRQYNSTYSRNSSTPNHLFHDNLPKNAIHLTPDTLPVILYNSTRVRIHNYILKFTFEGTTYEYLLYGDEDFVERYLDKLVIVRFDRQDMSKVFVYDMNSYKILLTADRFKKIPLAKANRDRKDELEIVKLGLDRGRLKKNIAKKMKDFQNNGSMPIETVIYDVDGKEMVHSSEEAYLLDKPAKPKVKRSKKVLPIKSFSSEHEIDLPLSFNQSFIVPGTGKLLN